ncbi:hypothetical protein PPL_02834 [Heterostelium album PN500]|uniref:B box-type domain-containing protein n=1 Tax=Heterostelium pallidum (strain ATCC 26659 / Pp 5 / PN500) TaxID=670386 RepID=D3B369_HETP5|nr:hypothetical protein PPL_02834 [Heterostelium album PN500]EFA83767.1 hypothetical protein PPL_02834 [Heterostelium album PN500]|eukprot:XP_020435884.1 hypothetical protein PPL_02834 [Heterostelium album PN500]
MSDTDNNNNIKSMSCIEHNKSFKVICYTCNRLLCLRCSFNHSKDQPDHYKHSEHIDDIKQSLKNIISDNIDISSSDNSDNSCDSKRQYATFIESRIDSIWKSLKSSSERYQTLTTKENQIKQHFEQLHQHLITEEHKLKKDIINDIDKIINQINKNIDELKHLNDILNMNINLNSSSSMHDNDNSNISNNSDSVVLDTTEPYSTTRSPIKLISSSSSLQSFIKENQQTLFNSQTINIKEQLEHYNNKSSSLALWNIATSKNIRKISIMISTSDNLQPLYSKVKVDRSDWRRNVLRNNPEVNNLCERIYPMNRGIIFDVPHDLPIVLHTREAAEQADSALQCTEIFQDRLGSHRRVCHQGDSAQGGQRAQEVARRILLGFRRQTDPGVACIHRANPDQASRSIGSAAQVAHQGREAHSIETDFQR